MIQANVIAVSGRAVEAAGDVDVLLLDRPVRSPRQPPGDSVPARAGRDAGSISGRCAVVLAGDETPERAQYCRAGEESIPDAEREVMGLEGTFIPFSAQTRMSGVDLMAARFARVLPTPSGRISKPRAGSFRLRFSDC